MTEEKLFQCEECGLHYGTLAIKEKCQQWCAENKSCNPEITQYSEEVKTQHESKAS